MNRTVGGLLVRSKSAVAVANILHGIVDEIGAILVYERTFVCRDGSWLSPDFSIEVPGGPAVSWEHLGMLSDEGYDAHWDEKLANYLASDVTVWPDTSGLNGTLTISTESVAAQGIDTQRIAEHARHVLVG